MKNKKIIIMIIWVLSGSAFACSKQSASDISIEDNNIYVADATKSGNPGDVEDNYIMPMKEGAKSHKGNKYNIGDLISYSEEYEVTIKGVQYDKNFVCDDLEAAEYFKTRPGLLSAYNSGNQSLVFVEAIVKNISDKEIDCAIGDSYIGNLYNDTDYYYLAECAAIYPTSYKDTTHNKYDKLGAGEEKNYTLCFKVRDKIRYGYQEDNTSSYSLENAYLALCITKATQKEHAPLVRLCIEDNRIVE